MLTVSRSLRPGGHPFRAALPSWWPSSRVGAAWLCTVPSPPPAGTTKSKRLTPKRAPLTSHDFMPRFPNATSGGLLRLADLMGTAVFAASGAITAGVTGMDLLGGVLVGTVTAIGGGTFRDAVVLNRRPFWVDEWEYVVIALVAALGTFLLWPSLPPSPLKTDASGEGPAMLIADAVSLGTFAIVGAMNGIRVGLNPLLVALCGVFTATFGGMTRDVLCQRPPRILHSQQEPYATVALMCSGMYMMCRAAGWPLSVRLAMVLAAAPVARWSLFAAQRKLPSWAPTPSPPPTASTHP